MISWTRAILGQTQDAPGVPDTVEEALELSASTPSRPPRARRPLPWSRLLLILFGATLLFGGGWLCTQQLSHARELEQQLALAHQDITHLHRQNTEWLQQLASFQTERTALDERVFSLSVQLSSASSELTRADARLAQAQQLAQHFSEVNAQLQIQLDAMREERNAARQEADRLRDDKRTLGQAVTRLRTRMTAVERRARHVAVQAALVKRSQRPVREPPAAAVPALSASPQPEAAASASAPVLPSTAAVATPMLVQLPPVVVTTEPATPPSLRGRLVSVNATHRFVVMDRGSENGIRVGMYFEILQGEHRIGHATVVRVHPRFSACDLSRETDPRFLHVGDRIVEPPAGS